MPYIGKQPLTGAYQLCDTITTSATATYNLTVGGSAVIPGSAQNCIVSLNGVIQAPVNAFTVSGSQITFASALTSNDVIDFILILGNVFDIGKPTNGTVTPSSLAGGTTGLISFQSVKTGNFTAVAGEGYFVNTTSGAITVTLPSGTPVAGSQVVIIDYAGTADTNAITINPNGNKIEGGTSNLALTGEREGVTLTYVDSTQGWLATSGINEGTDALGPPPYSIDFLVVAGGGGGGGDLGGGGGAGGYRTSTQLVNVGTVITVTVGDGGAQSGTTRGTDTKGNSGSNSSISGTGLTTITSAGGGGGGAYQSTGSYPNGISGGSGGGGGGYDTPATSVGGTGNTPSTSPSQGNNGGTGIASTNYTGGGGGGAGGVGANATQTANGGGAGGTGTASSITGSSVTRAGGGGGSAYGIDLASAGGTGGSGGGGNGGFNSTSPNNNGIAGTANTGGGGGAGSNNGYGGAGGKGVVILSVPTASYSSTTTGSPTVTTSGSNTIMQFNGSGSYTA